MKKYIYIALASFFVFCGVLGIFLPLIPTTPFLLLATMLYMKSSKRRLRWLLSHKYLGPYIHSYFSKEGIPLRLKIKTISMLWITLFISAYFVNGNIHVYVILLLVGIGVTTHIFLKKTKKNSI